MTIICNNDASMHCVAEAGRMSLSNWSELETLVVTGREEKELVVSACERRERSMHLVDAKVLSKFDLKSGFWQLVMSFSLKNAPSAFQKAMITTFEPILANTLVYIDDILLFSPGEQSHAKLLSKFYSLVTKYGIMLSEKKMEVGVTTIQFLGMEISDRKY
ncbi:putative reverse transcriptase domain, viral movement protein [Tanacetum coccineum]